MRPELYSGPVLLPERNSINLKLLPIWFIQLLVSLDINAKFLSKVTVCAPVCTTNPQILIAICCIHPASHPSHVKNSISHSQLDFVVFVVTALINSKKQRKCAISPTDVADICRPAYLHYWRYETVRYGLGVSVLRAKHNQYIFLLQSVLATLGTEQLP